MSGKRTLLTTSNVHSAARVFDALFQAREREHWSWIHLHLESLHAMSPKPAFVIYSTFGLIDEDPQPGPKQSYELQLVRAEAFVKGFLEGRNHAA